MLAAASAGLAVAGLPGVALGAAFPLLIPLLPRKRPRQPNVRLVLLILLVEVRSGYSVLAALQEAADVLRDHGGLRRAARVATVSGLTSALPVAGPGMRPVLAELARAQVSGASIAGTLRSMLDRDLARERAERIAAARALPVRLMVPVTLLMLPGLVLVLYAPSLLRLFHELMGVWG